MNKKRFGFLTLAATSITAIPTIAVSCNNEKVKNYDQLIEITVNPEIKQSKEAKNVIKTDIQINKIEGLKIEVKSLVASNVTKSKLIVTLNVTEKTGKSIEVIKEIDGFKVTKVSNNNNSTEPNINEGGDNTQTPTPDSNSQKPNPDAKKDVEKKENSQQDSFVKSIRIVKSVKSSEFFNKIQGDTIIFYDFGRRSFFDKEYDKSNQEANKNRVELFHLENFVPAFGVNVAHPTDTTKSINKAILSKEGNNYSLKFKFGQYDSKTKNTTVFDKVYTTVPESFEFRTKEELDNKIDTLTLSYPEANTIIDNQATQDKLKLSDDNEKMAIKSFEIQNGQGKVKVSFVITSQIGKETLESKIKEVTIDGFKVDDFESKLVGVTLDYPDKQNVTIKNIDVTKFTLSKDNATFQLPENAKVACKKVENSENKYKGTITIEATFTNDGKNIVKTYDVSGFKTEPFNLQTYVNSFESVTLDPSINKDETSTNSITKDSFTLGEFDKKAVNIEITDGKINEANTSEYILSLTFTDLVNEGTNALKKEITISGFKAGEEIKHYLNKKVAEFAKAQKLFIVDKEEVKKNTENFKNYISQEKKPYIKVANGDIMFNVKSFKKNKITGIKINPDLGVNSLTHGGRTTFVAPTVNAGSNVKGISLSIDDKTGDVKFQFWLYLEGGGIDDVMYEQVLFNTKK
ncbi:hypothetical protein [Mycoplasma zalophidermidis]|uniref:hypothetical protein n=1 Tax=Mycoplasma zalophidermidis TaxID=398174 RepID=UPI00215C95D3|nr:hypothetical protein [Mycoplasma zalophidermidis]MCR8966270.1 hypothetical protein [Mycoplasma zalophidermidis]